MKLKDISHIRGLSAGQVFAVDTQSKPGKVIMHLVRFETIELNNDESFDQTTFKMLHDDNDKRLAFFGQCFGGNTE